MTVTTPEFLRFLWFLLRSLRVSGFSVLIFPKPPGIERLRRRPICPRQPQRPSQVIRSRSGPGHLHPEIGRASCRERVEISVVAVSLEKTRDVKRPQTN